MAERDDLRAARRTSPPTEIEVKAWLVEHYSDTRKMPSDRMDLLLGERESYPYLDPPIAGRIFRGIFNVTSAGLKNLQDVLKSDAVRDKSWTTSSKIAHKFADGEFTDEEPINGRFSVLLTAPMPRPIGLLNASLAADEPGIGDVVNKRWNEALSVGIRVEREILVAGSVKLNSVDSTELEGSPTTVSASTAKPTSPTGFHEDDEFLYSDYSAARPSVRDNVLYIPVVDVIAAGGWGATTSPKSVREALLRFPDAERIVVEIDSPGGILTDGISIYNYLQQDGRPLEARVYGLAASAASVILLAADDRVLLPGSLVMIHEASVGAWGTEVVMEQGLQQLRAANTSLVTIYATRTGSSADALKTAMRNETWLSADDAIDWGFGTRLGEGVVPAEATASASSDWHDRRGQVLAGYKNPPSRAGFEQPLGWRGHSADELVAATAVQSVQSGLSLAVALERVTVPARSQPPRVAQPPPRVAQPAQPAPTRGTEARAMDEKDKADMADMRALLAETKTALTGAREAAEAATAHAKAADELRAVETAAAAAAAEDVKRAAAKREADLVLKQYDAEVKVFMETATPSVGACYADVLYTMEPDGTKAPNPSVLAAAKAALASMPGARRTDFEGPSPQVETAAVVETPDASIAVEGDPDGPVKYRAPNGTMIPLSRFVPGLTNAKLAETKKAMKFRHDLERMQ